MKQPIDVLVIEDDSEDYLLFKDMVDELRPRRYRLNRCDNFDDGVQRMRMGGFGLYVVDYYLGAHTAEDFLAQAQASGVRTPIIVLTGRSDDAIDEQVLAGGAADYLVKGELSADAIGRSFRHALARQQTLEALLDAQRQVARRERTLSTVLADAIDALLVLDATGRLVYENGQAQRLRQLAPEAWKDLVADLPTDHSQTQERDLPLPHGGARALELRASATEWDGTPATMVVVRDVTARKAAVRGLHVSHRAIESSVNGIVIAEAAGDDAPIIYVNPAFEQMTGYTREEVIGRNCRFLQGEERDQPGIGQLRDAVKARRETTVVLRNYRKDGTPFHNEIHIGLVRDTEGAVTHFIGILVDVTERMRYQAEAAFRATHDVLTGLPNRVLLQDRLKQALAFSRRHHAVIAVLFIDLDHFKTINDSLGHEAGDRVLQDTARRISACLREGDTVCRSGGDEFIVMLPDLVQESDAIGVTTRIISVVGEPYEHQGRPLFIGCSVGVALAPRDVVDPSLLLRQADIAMHAAKKAGRNGYCVYSDDLDRSASERLDLRNRLQQAIGGREFELHYQPQFEVGSGRMCGIEALLRWNDPHFGQIGPSSFVPLAEDTGQIVQIGNWVIHEACRRAAAWTSRGLIDCPVAVNVSGVQFQRQNFVELVAAALGESGLKPQLLELELTESVMMAPNARTDETIRRLRELGVRLSIDDFGTGFSSLSYLKRLPVEKVKIDRSFIRDITQDSGDSSIVLSIIAIAHHLKLRVIAEGVETEAQLSYLRRHLCDEVQGYHLSRPLSAEGFEQFLAVPRSAALQSLCATAETDRRTLLLVDDEANVLRALARALRRDGYRLLTASSAEEAFDVLARNEVQVIVSDQRMPGMTGTQFLGQVKDLYPHTVRMILSGYTDLQTVTDAINRGAIYRFLTKPWEDEALRAHVREAFQHGERHRQGASV